jgi:hypothetical protein
LQGESPRDFGFSSSRFFFVTLTPQKVDVKKAASLFEEEFFGCPSIGHQKASSERKETGQKRGIKDQAQDFDQKGAASNRIEESRYGFCSDQSGRSSLGQSRQQRNDHA